jgi:hypothetical protein
MNTKTQELIRLLEKEKQSLLDKVKSIDNTILIIRQSNTGDDDSFNTTSKNEPQENLVPEKSLSDYESSFSLKKKALYFLRRENRFLHNREFVELINNAEPSLEEPNLHRKISSTLSQLKREGKVINIVVGKSLRNTFWGAPKWQDENKNIIKGYEYKEEYLTDNLENEIEL